MIAGIFHKGSGVGNQLHRYVATRVLALDKGYDFTMIAPTLCKVKDFMNLDMGVETGWGYDAIMPNGEVIKMIVGYKTWREGTNYYNPEFNFIEDDTIIDGEFQDERYFEHRLNEVDEWLKVEPIDVPDDVCVIGMRGGEYRLFPELFLSWEYWFDAVQEMLKVNKNMKFEIHTDDKDIMSTLPARPFFTYKVITGSAINWRSMRYAKHAIIANSSFYILPRLLNGGITIAPRYWARHNTKEWSMPQNYYKCFTYL